MYTYHTCTISARAGKSVGIHTFENPEIAAQSVEIPHKVWVCIAEIRQTATSTSKHQIPVWECEKVWKCVEKVWQCIQKVWENLWTSDHDQNISGKSVEMCGKVWKSTQKVWK